MMVSDTQNNAQPPPSQSVELLSSQQQAGISQEMCQFLGIIFQHSRLKHDRHLSEKCTTSTLCSRIMRFLFMRFSIYAEVVSSKTDSWFMRFSQIILHLC